MVRKGAARTIGQELLESTAHIHADVAVGVYSETVLAEAAAAFRDHLLIFPPEASTDTAHQAPRTITERDAHHRPRRDRRQLLGLGKDGVEQRCFQAGLRLLVRSGQVTTRGEILHDGMSDSAYDALDLFVGWTRCKVAKPLNRKGRKVRKDSLSQRHLLETTRNADRSTDRRA